MAVDMFLKLDGIDGESQDRNHPGEVEIFSYSWGLSNSGSLASGGGGGTGKASFQDLHFESTVSKASPKLALFCASGRHIQKATLTVRKAGGKAPIEFIKITMEDVLVSSYQQAGSAAGDQPEDAFSLNFAKVEFDYTAQKADGSPDQEVTFSWDLKENREG